MDKKAVYVSGFSGDKALKALSEKINSMVEDSHERGCMITLEGLSYYEKMELRVLTLEYKEKKEGLR